MRLCEVKRNCWWRMNYLSLVIVFPSITHRICELFKSGMESSAKRRDCRARDSGEVDKENGTVSGVVLRYLQTILPRMDAKVSSKRRTSWCERLRLTMIPAKFLYSNIKEIYMKSLIWFSSREEDDMGHYHSGGWWGDIDNLKRVFSVSIRMYCNITGHHQKLWE